MHNREHSSDSNVSLRQIALLFFKLGVIGFGGPAAHIALMHREVVLKRQWLDEQQFLDLLGATNLIPGPNSTELSIHIGREKRGWKGLLVAGTSFILPAVIITGCLAALYTRYGKVPQIAPFIYGIKPALIAVIIAAVLPLAKKSLKTRMLWFIGIASLVLSVLNVDPLYIMFGAGIVAMLVAQLNNGSLKAKFFIPAMLCTDGIPVINNSLATLFFTFLKIGAILYGSGYVLFAYIESEVVAKGLINHQQLADAIAVGQFTPGPVFSSVTFVGYVAAGVPGALVSTIAIFLPSFIFVAALNPLVGMLRKSRLFSAFLDAVNLASIALIAGVCLQLGIDAFSSWKTIAIGAVSLAAVLYFKNINSAWVILGGAVAGYLLQFI